MHIFRSFLHTLTSFLDKIQTTRENYFQKGADVMHTMWKGTISFGLVNIPVQMHAATENKDIRLRQLQKKCQSPIKYKKTGPVCDEEGKDEDIVKAYEYAKDKYVVFDEEELKPLKKEQTDNAVEIIYFDQIE